jgi:hypothetical protein
MLPDTIKTRGLHAGIRFAPLGVLDKQHKQQFQAKANEGFDWQRQEYAENLWRLTTPQPGGGPRSHLKLTLQPDAFNFEDSFPADPIDLFSDNLKLGLDVLAAVFSPKLIIGVGIVVRLAAQSDPPDAREYLGNRCLKLDDKLAPLGRPVHGVGLKLLLPPLPREGATNWQAIVKVESLVEDVRQLYIEVDARWANPFQWNPQSVVDCVKTTHDFATTQVADFLHNLGKAF